MRLYPPAAVVREALHDLEIDGYLVPRGYTLYIVPYTLHRKAEYFPDPETFEPERFTPEREKQLPRHAYLPFGAGPRICIGNHFALMEGQLLLATLAQRVTFSLLPGQTIKPDTVHNLTLSPGGTMEVIVKRRNP
jgi:cytochrome P450